MPNEISHITKAPGENYDMDSRILTDLYSINEAKKQKFGVEGSFYHSQYALTKSHSEKKFRETAALVNGVTVDSTYPVAVIKVNIKQDMMFDEHPNSLVREWIKSRY
jgi:hypothetical protein